MATTTTTTSTPFNLPLEVFCDYLLPNLPNSAILSSWCTSTDAQRCITGMLHAKYKNPTLDGKEVSISFTGEFPKAVQAFFQYRKKMATLQRHPEFLTEIASARAILQSKGYLDSYTALDFINAIPSGVPHKEALSLQRKISLALIPFDLRSHALSAFNKYPIGLKAAIAGAVQSDDIELVNLVLSHPNAMRLECYDLEVALNCKKPSNPKIRLALLAHPNAKSLREKRERPLFRTLLKMLRKKYLLLDEYFRVFDLLHPKTQCILYKRLCRHFGSPTNDFIKDGTKHLRDNPRSLLKVLRNKS